MNFDEAFELLLGHEGNYSDHASDPGGKTRYGVTERVARDVGYRGDMRDLPLDLAKRVYLENYWKPMRCDELPSVIRYVAFDAAVNSGCKQATLWLQRAVGAAEDGLLGSKTLAALNTANAWQVRCWMLGTRLEFMTDLSHWPAFGRGWGKRIAKLLKGL